MRNQVRHSKFVVNDSEKLSLKVGLVHKAPYAYCTHINRILVDICGLFILLCLFTLAEEDTLLVEEDVSLHGFEPQVSDLQVFLVVSGHTE